jgi:hypothetical protein
MRAHRVLICLMAWLVVGSLGEPLPMIEQAYANCCSPSRCNSWGLMLYGTAELPEVPGNMAQITVGKESYSIEVEETFLKRLQEERMAEKTNGPAHGFVIVHGFGETAPKKLMVTDFLPANPKLHHKKLSVQEAVNNYQNLKEYKDDLKEYRTKK